jgi:hypothetical protein
MLVVVPEARHEEFARGIDDFRAFRRFHCSVGTDTHDVTGSDQHARARCDGQIAGIKQPGIADEQITSRNVGELLRELR